jgi:hypothetical protein
VRTYFGSGDSPHLEVKIVVRRPTEPEGDVATITTEVKFVGDFTSYTGKPLGKPLLGVGDRLGAHQFVADDVQFLSRRGNGNRGEPEA